MSKGLWEDALDDANQVCPRRLSGSVLINMKSLGNIIRSVISMGLREGVDGVGKSESETWFVEGCPVCRS